MKKLLTFADYLQFCCAKNEESILICDEIFQPKKNLLLASEEVWLLWNEEIRSMA